MKNMKRLVMQLAAFVMAFTIVIAYSPIKSFAAVETMEVIRGEQAAPNGADGWELVGSREETSTTVNEAEIIGYEQIPVYGEPEIIGYEQGEPIYGEVPIIGYENGEPIYGEAPITGYEQGEPIFGEAPIVGYEDGDPIYGERPITGYKDGDPIYGEKPITGYEKGDPIYGDAPIVGYEDGEPIYGNAPIIGYEQGDPIYGDAPIIGYEQGDPIYSELKIIGYEQKDADAGTFERKDLVESSNSGSYSGTEGNGQKIGSDSLSQKQTDLGIKVQGSSIIVPSGLTITVRIQSGDKYSYVDVTGLITFKDGNNMWIHDIQEAKVDDELKPIYGREIIGYENGDPIYGDEPIIGYKDGDPIYGDKPITGYKQGDPIYGDRPIIGHENGDPIYGEAPIIGYEQGDPIYGEPEFLGYEKGAPIYGERPITGYENGNPIFGEAPIIGYEQGDPIFGIAEIIGYENGEPIYSVIEIIGYEDGEPIYGEEVIMTESRFIDIYQRTIDDEPESFIPTTPSTPDTTPTTPFTPATTTSTPPAPLAQAPQAPVLEAQAEPTADTDADMIVFEDFIPLAQINEIQPEPEVESVIVMEEEPVPLGSLPKTGISNVMLALIFGIFASFSATIVSAGFARKVKRSSR